MGRTKRIRCRKKNKLPKINLDHDLVSVDLRKWLIKSGWSNETGLKLYDFPETGRGLLSNKTVNPGDNLITIPYNLMITYTTILNSNLFEILSPCEDGFKIHDLLALFLAFEKHKGEKSHWKYYIRSLPTTPPSLPWLCSNLDILPEDLKPATQKAHNDFKKSLERLKKSIKSHQCLECQNSVLDCVLDENVFAWAYVLVNTRAVYVDPQLIYKMNDDNNIHFKYNLQDSPCMALCPYLDMFNHNDSARTDAKLTFKNNKWVYQLQSLTSVKKYLQIFISYGAHDNIKLFVEYGFFIPGNKFDFIRFDFKNIIRQLSLDFNERQYKFLTEHNLLDELYIGISEISFNLKALLFVAFNKENRNCQQIIYSDSYSEDFNTILSNCVKILLNYKLLRIKNEFSEINKCVLDNNWEMVKNFCKYRIDFVQNILATLK